MEGLYDPDGDALTPFVDWWVNGQVVSRSAYLEPSFFHRGDTVHARVQATDGTAWSESRDTSEVIIRNTPPQIHVASIESASDIHGFSEVEIVATVSDLDGDPVSIEWVWYLDEAPFSQAGNQLALPGVPAGARLVALGIPNDGADQGEALRTPEVEVGIVPAEVASVRVEPELPIHRDDLRCSVESASIALPDASGFKWKVDPSTDAMSQAASELELVGGEVPWRRTAAGDHWTCIANWPGGLELDKRVEIEQGPPGGNILLVMLDDVGVDNIGIYGEHPNPPPTPTIDALAEQGVLFRNHYTYPLCSPSRAALMTGRYGYRTGIGQNIDGDGYLPTEEVGIAEALNHSTHYGYSNSMVGKWHLAGSSMPDRLMHPAAFGFEWFSVVMANIREEFPNNAYRKWVENENGRNDDKYVYVTTEQTNDALSRIEAMPQPWFLVLSYTAPHTPTHVPPDRLHSFGLEIQARHRRFDAMLEAADTELGRLLRTIDPEVLADTTIIVLGDNGTPEFAVTAPFSSKEAKGTLHDGGTRVPLIINGPLVAEAGSEVSALTHIVDIFPTVAEIAGVEIEELFGSESGPGSLVDWSIDGESLIPFLEEPDRLGREILYTERFGPNEPNGPHTYWKQSLRDERWRYIRGSGGQEGLYDLTAKYPNAGPNLLDEPLSEEAVHAWFRLSIDLDQIEADMGQN
jgi:arylsulfatase A-like enzyme